MNTTTSPPRKKLNPAGQKIADEIERGLRVLIGSGDVVELRALHVTEQYGRPSEHSGYYDTDHLAEMAHDATALTSRSTGVYWTLNPVIPSLLARRANREERVGTGDTTSDRHVVRRRWLLVDADTIRPAGISATDAEKEHARRVIIDVDAFLADEGWPTPIMCDSGNGYHLLYRIDLPADDCGLVKRCLAALAAKFSDEHVGIDKSVFNAARICKLYGTLARKGDNIPDRPHRRSEILTIPDAIDIVPIELLEKLAAMAPADAPKPDAKRNGHAPHSQHSPSRHAGLSPGDDFAARGDVRGVLLRHAWTQVSGGDNEHWTRPGKQDGGTSATLKGGCLHVFSDNAEPFESNKSYGPFAVVTMLDYGGDYAAAAKELAAQGYGTTPTPTPKTNGTAPPVHPTPSRPVTPLAAGTRVRAKDRDNFGEVVADDGGPTVTVHFVSASGDEATVDLPREVLLTVDGRPVVASPPIIPVPASELLARHSHLRPVVIDGIARQGETVNVISASKIGKSWLAYSLLFSVVTGRQWLDRFDCAKGRVLLIDNELHAPTLAHRLDTVATALGLADADWRESLDIISLRGAMMDIETLGPTIDAIEPGKYALVVADALYRFWPRGISENDNGDVTQVYNRIDQYAEHLQSAWLNIHHASKGDQSGKSVVDVGSGAGAQSRAADSHLILRPHEERDVVVLEAAVRSFPPVAPVSLRWNYPLWHRADGVDPRKLRGSAADDRQQQKDEVGKADILLALANSDGQPMSARQLRSTGLSRERLERLLSRLERDGRIVRDETKVKGNATSLYHIPPDPDDDDEKQTSEKRLFS